MKKVLVIIPVFLLILLAATQTVTADHLSNNPHSSAAQAGTLHHLPFLGWVQLNENRSGPNSEFIFDLGTLPYTLTISAVGIPTYDYPFSGLNDLSWSQPPVLTSTIRLQSGQSVWNSYTDAIGPGCGPVDPATGTPTGPDLWLHYNTTSDYLPSLTFFNHATITQSFVITDMVTNQIVASGDAAPGGNFATAVPLTGTISVNTVSGWCATTDWNLGWTILPQGTPTPGPTQTPLPTATPPIAQANAFYRIAWELYDPTDGSHSTTVQMSQTLPYTISVWDVNQPDPTLVPLTVYDHPGGFSYHLLVNDEPYLVKTSDQQGVKFSAIDSHNRSLLTGAPTCAVEPDPYIGVTWQVTQFGTAQPIVRLENNTGLSYHLLIENAGIDLIVPAGTSSQVSVFNWTGSAITYYGTDYLQACSTVSWDFSQFQPPATPTPTPASQYQILPDALSPAQVGQTYTAWLWTNPIGVLPDSWTILQGVLPPGLALDSGPGTELITGNPTTPGSYTFTMEYQGGDGGHGSKVYTLVVNGTVAATPTPTFTPTMTPSPSITSTPVPPTPTPTGTPPTPTPTPQYKVFVPLVIR